MTDIFVEPETEGEVFVERDLEYERWLEDHGYFDPIEEPSEEAIRSRWVVRPEPAFVEDDDIPF